MNVGLGASLGLAAEFGAPPQLGDDVRPTQVGASNAPLAPFAQSRHGRADLARDDASHQF